MLKKITLAGVLILSCLMCACSFFTKHPSSDGSYLQPWTDHSSASPDAADWKVYTFSDTTGTEYKSAADPYVPACPYDSACFNLINNRMSYEDENYHSRLGVDVSYYQGSIDWEKVREAGFSFAFIRIGFRGYGSEGNINPDDNFLTNIKGAQAAGLDTGVYFFSQAISDEEAVEEARFVIKTLKDHAIKLQLPVAFDPERVFETGSRTLHIDDRQFTYSSLAFCREMEKAGYDTAIYASMMWEAFTLDMESLGKYPIWYSDYRDRPQTPYYFRWWQYSCRAKVDGIGPVCDINIEMIPK